MVTIVELGLCVNYMLLHMEINKRVYKKEFVGNSSKKLKLIKAGAHAKPPRPARWARLLITRNLLRRYTLLETMPKVLLN